MPKGLYDYISVLVAFCQVNLKGPTLESQFLALTCSS